MTFPRSILRSAVLAVAVVTAGAAAPARADFVLDDFSAPSPALVYSITSTNPNPYTTPPQPLANGFSRTATVTVTSGLGPTSATGQIGGGIFEQSTPAASTAFSRIDYTTAAPVNWGPTGEGVTGISTRFTFADLSVPYSVVLTDADGGSSTFTGTIAGSGTFNAALDQFTGNVNLDRVSGVSVILNRNVNTGASTTSADFILDEVNVPANPVPAPPAALLALAALPALGLRRLLRKKK